MNEFASELGRRLEKIQSKGLRRQLRRVDSAQSPRINAEGEALLNFSSNDYLGLANHPDLKEAAIRAIEQFGTGSGASRLICGSLGPHYELEMSLAAFKKTESALTFSSGYTAALGTICAVAGKDDVVILDKSVHASIVDAARLSGAKLRVFAHNDLNELAEIFQWADKREAGDTASHRPRTLIVTESVFSMDGDQAPLREIVALKEKHGAWLMVDEAHSTGLFGDSGRGLADELGLSGRIEIQMGTMGKALGSAGGFICGPRALTDYLVNSARTFIFSTAPNPAAAAAANAAVELVQSGEGATRRKQLWSLVEQLKSGLSQSGWSQTEATSAIIPLVVGDEASAMDAATALRKRGIYVPAIRFPSVARGQARLRLTLSASHSPEDVNQLLDALRKCINNPESKVKDAQPRAT